MNISELGDQEIFHPTHSGWDQAYEDFRNHEIAREAIRASRGKKLPSALIDGGRTEPSNEGGENGTQVRPDQNE